MIRLPILLLLINIVLSTVEENTLAVAIPSYMSSTDTSFPFQLLYGLCWLVLTIFGALHLPRLFPYQINMLGTISCVLFTKHIILTYVLPIDRFGVFSFIVLVLLGFELLLIGFLALGIGFRHIFASIGVGYVLAYELVLIFQISSFSLFVVLMVCCMIGLYFVAQASDFMFNCFVKTFALPFFFYLAVDRLAVHTFGRMHSGDTYLVVSWLCQGILLVCIIVCFGLVYFQEQIQEKVEQITKDLVTNEEDRELEAESKQASEQV